MSDLQIIYDPEISTTKPNPIIIHEDVNQIVEHIEESIAHSNLDPNLIPHIRDIKNSIKRANLGCSNGCYMEESSLTNENIILYMTNLLEVALDATRSDHQRVFVFEAIEKTQTLFDAYEEIHSDITIDRNVFSDILENTTSHHDYYESTELTPAIERYYREVLNNMDRFIGETSKETYDNIRDYVIHQITEKESSFSNVLLVEARFPNPLPNNNPQNNQAQNNQAQNNPQNNQAQNNPQNNQDKLKQYLKFLGLGAVGAGIITIGTTFSKIHNNIRESAKEFLKKDYTNSDVLKELSTLKSADRNAYDNIISFLNGQKYDEKSLTRFLQANHENPNYRLTISEFQKAAENLPNVSLNLKNLINETYNNYTEFFMNTSNIADKLNTVTTYGSVIGWSFASIFGTSVLIWLWNNKIRDRWKIANNHITFVERLYKIINHKKYNITNHYEFPEIVAKYEKCKSGGMASGGEKSIPDLTGCDVEFAVNIHSAICYNLLSDMRKKGTDLNKFRIIEDVYRYDAFETTLIPNYADRIESAKKIHDLVTKYQPQSATLIKTKTMAIFDQLKKKNDSVKSFKPSSSR